MANQIDVSIIIVNYNTLKLTQDCIESIFNLTEGISFEVIVVDNASSDGSKDVFDNDSRIKYIYSKKNLGFGQGNNIGAEYANGKYLFFLNPDTLLENNAIYILANFLDCNPSAVACGGNLYDSQGNPTHSFRRYLPGFKWEINLFSLGLFDLCIYGKNSEFNYSDKVLKVGYISGADLMIPKSIFIENNGFSKDFFLYYEETDLCNRIKQNGGEIFSVPMAKIRHLESKSFPAEQKKYRATCVENGYQIYLKKNFSGYKQFFCGALHNFYSKLKLTYLNQKS